MRWHRPYGFVRGQSASSGELKELLGIGEQAAENGLRFPFDETAPLQFGHFFDELLHLLVVFHGAANAFVPGFGNTDLAELSIVALNQVQRLVQFTSSATAGRFAAFARPV